jgi:hypothetical protein
MKFCHDGNQNEIVAADVSRLWFFARESALRLKEIWWKRIKRRRAARIAAFKKSQTDDFSIGNVVCHHDVEAGFKVRPVSPYLCQR